MKLILTREVSGLGQPGDIVEVADGYGRNYLVPRGAAINWTKGAEKQISQIRRAQDAREIRGLDHAKEIKSQLEGSVRHADRPGRRRWQAVRLGHADRYRQCGQGRRRANGGQEAGRTCPDTSRRTGAHTVTIELHSDVVATVPVTVSAG